MPLFSICEDILYLRLLNSFLTYTFGVFLSLNFSTLFQNGDVIPFYMFGCLYFATQYLQSVIETLYNWLTILGRYELYSVSDFVDHAVNRYSKPLCKYFFLLFSSYTCTSFYFLRQDVNIELRLFKQQTFHHFCCSVIGFVKESCSTPLCVLHARFRVLAGCGSLKFAHIQEKVLSITLKNKIFHLMREAVIEWANSKHDRKAELEWESTSFEGDSFMLQCIFRS